MRTLIALLCLLCSIDVFADTIWSNSAVPSATAPSTDDYNLGTKFHAAAGYVIGIRYYRLSNDPGPHIGRLYNSAARCSRR
jgi:hypothetical protein